MVAMQQHHVNTPTATGLSEHLLVSTTELHLRISNCITEHPVAHDPLSAIIPTQTEYTQGRDGVRTIASNVVQRELATGAKLKWS